MNHRACVGKNLANMELQIFVATIFRRYAFVLEDPEKHVSDLTLARPLRTDRVSFARSSTLSRDSSVDQSRAELA